MDSQTGTEVRKRLYWIAAARAVLCLFAAAIIRLNVEFAGSLEKLLPYIIVLSAFALNFVYLALARSRAPWRATGAVQTFLDVVFISALVCATGGTASDFSLLYFGPVLASAVLFKRNSALLFASLSTIGLFSCAAVYTMGTRPPAFIDDAWLVRQQASPAGLVGVLVLQGAAFHLVAYLSSTLTLRLRSANIETAHILENMSDGVITAARDAHVVFANSRAREMLSLSEDRPLVGASLGEIAPGKVCRAFLQVVSSGEEAAVEVKMGDEQIAAQVTVLPFLDPAGKLRGANIILHDLTERDSLSKALRRAERLEAAAATAASIAHEIRNPLAAIRGSAQELGKLPGLSGPDARLVELVVRESDRLDRVLTEFLKFSRMAKPQVSDFDLRELLDEVASQIVMSSVSRKADVCVEGPPEMTVAGDSEQLRQVLVNIGLNALDATGGQGAVSLVLERVPGGANIRVRDNGGGIDHTLRERVFEPFFTTKTTGTGLGLPIARQIVEEHSGTIELEDDKEGWTCVKVFLPQAERQR